MKDVTPRTKKTNWLFFLFGVLLFIFGAYLISDLVMKFLRFTMGLILIFISFFFMFGEMTRFYVRRYKRR